MDESGEHHPQLSTLKKQEKTRRKGERIKIRVEINEIENRKTMKSTKPKVVYLKR